MRGYFEKQPVTKNRRRKKEKERNERKWKIEEKEEEEEEEERACEGNHFGREGRSVDCLIGEGR